MIALVICDIDFDAASSAVRPSRIMRDCVFSTTTIASSTSEPMTSMSPNIVSTFRVKPNARRNANVPRIAIGIAIAGTNVARQSWRNRYVMATTSTSAMRSVLNVSFRNTSVNAVVSSPSTASTPGGRREIHFSTSFFTRAAVSTAFASGDLYTSR